MGRYVTHDHNDESVAKGSEARGSSAFAVEAYPSIQQVANKAQHIGANIERVIDGKPEVVRMALMVLLAEGHLLIEDVPGVGKTKLAKALARSIDCSVRRIQFTPDLLPSDITGVSIYNRQTQNFQFKPGAIFANLVVGDEINRASPKTQSALLECMEERQVTVDAVTYQLEAPFMVIATSNPIDMEGTYPLPEAQRDRFTVRVSVGYPDLAAEMTMLADNAQRDPLETLRPVTTAAEISQLIAAVRGVYVSDAVYRYSVELVHATRTSAAIRLGGSPRSSLQLMRLAKARAALHNRDYVTPDDVQALASPVLAHRIILTPQARMDHRSADQVIAEIVRRLPVHIAQSRHRPK